MACSAKRLTLITFSQILGLTNKSLECRCTVDTSWCYLFTQTAGIFEQVIHHVGLLSLLCNLRVLARQCKVWQNVDHDLWETVCQ